MLPTMTIMDETPEAVSCYSSELCSFGRVAVLMVSLHSDRYPKTELLVVFTTDKSAAFMG